MISPCWDILPGRDILPCWDAFQFAFAGETEVVLQNHPCFLGFSDYHITKAQQKTDYYCMRSDASFMPARQDVLPVSVYMEKIILASWDIPLPKQDGNIPA